MAVLTDSHSRSAMRSTKPMLNALLTMRRPNGDSSQPSASIPQACSRAMKATMYSSTRSTMWTSGT